MTRKMTENDNSVRGLWDMPVLTVTVGTDTGAREAREDVSAQELLETS